MAESEAIDPHQSLVPTRAAGHGDDLSTHLGTLPQWTVSQPTAARSGALAPGQAGQDSSYELIRVVGRGGMGEVWEARQRSLGRRVAVKKLIEDTAESAGDRRAREYEFRLEAHVAASLEHPNIVPVHDVGADADGSPLIAMKLVEGKPWNQLIREDFESMAEEDYLSRHIPILMAMAQAVAFAHSRGIVHRDLKPAQVLVGAFGEVLLTDWGLAIRMEDQGAAADGEWSIADDWGVPTPLSASNPAGTPSLMAPEQTRADGLGIGPWTDVYLLGGTLYALLTGTSPHRANSSKEAIAVAASGVVEPPSRRAPGRRIPEDLEALCLEALAADPAKRTPSAKHFFDALEAHVRGTARRAKSAELAAEAAAALDAAGEGSGYREFAEAQAAVAEARRLWPDNPALEALHARTSEGMARRALQTGDLMLARVQAEMLAQGGGDAGALLAEIAAEEARGRRRRHLLRGAAAAVFALTALIAAGATAFTFQLRRANKETAAQRDRAREAEALAAKRAEEAERNFSLAMGQADASAELVNFVIEDLKSAMNEELSAKLDAKDANTVSHAIAGRAISPVKRYYDSIDIAAWPQELQKELVAQRIEAANSFMAADRTDEAMEMTSATLGLTRTVFGDDDPLYATLLSNLADFHERGGMPERAFALQEEALAAMARAKDAKPHHLALLLVHRGNSLIQRGEPDKALATLRDAVAKYEESMGADAIETLRAKSRLALCLSSLGKSEESQDVYAAVMEAYARSTEPLEVADAAAMANYAAVLNSADRAEDALPYAQRAYDLLEKLSGPVSDRTLDALSMLASTHFRLGNDAEAEAACRVILSRREKTLSAGNPLIDKARANLGGALIANGKPEEAAALLEECVKSVEARFGPDSRELETPLNNLANAYRDARKPDLADPAYRRLIGIRAKALGPRHSEVARIYTSYYFFLNKVPGRESDALDAIEHAAGIYEETAPESPVYFRCLSNRASALDALGRREEALSAMEDASAAATAALGEGEYATWQLRMAQASLLRNADRIPEAIELNRAVVQWHNERFGADNQRTRQPFRELLLCLRIAGQHGEALAMARSLVASDIKRNGPAHPDVADSRQILFSVLEAAARSESDPDRARALAEEAAAIAEEDKLFEKDSRDRVRFASALKMAGRDEESRAMMQAALDSGYTGGPDIHPQREFQAIRARLGM